MHAILRLLTAIEIACFQSSYDPASAECIKLIADERIYVPTYTETLHNACKLGEYTDIVVLRLLLMKHRPCLASTKRPQHMMTKTAC